MHIIGTAGHVDHGKSSLVTALTGTNPDRWIEEQVRGMTLDLGFARLPFDDGSEAGIVDVPGHARFLHNMLAGAAGMELLLLVVAANEGIMPQTIEHLQILRYLNVQRVVVALTKIDLIAPERKGEACRFVHRELQGTIAENAPIFAVSTVTGENLDVLKLGLQFELAALQPRDADAPAYMPVDRVFSLPGRGTIVTGTLMQGRIKTGDALALEPRNAPVRVRSIHVFGQARDEVFGGTRVAINVPGIETREISRGEVVADPQFQSRTTFNVSFTPLDEALGTIKRRTPVRAHIGSAEILGTLVLPLAPERGETVRGELFLKAPALAFPGVRFVVRRVSPKTLLGGGEIIGLESAAPSDDVRDASLRAVFEALRERGSDPSEVREIAFATNLREDAVQRALATLLESGDAVKVLRPDGYLSASAAQEQLDVILTTLLSSHEREPWSMGMTSLALSRALQRDEKLLIRLLAAFVEEGRLSHRAGYYAATEHVPKLSNEQRTFFDRAVPVDPAAPFVPVDFEAVAAGAKSGASAGLPKAFETLLARGVLVRVGEALYRGSQIEQIHRNMASFIERNGRMTMAEFRDLLGTSRKYAVPLLEWFDGRGITVRSGDYRMLRTRKGQ
ncbi:MAG: selenocysteine-specific translation elongation factor [Candidatus Eremiobacteraeota bacterium]|nr:selenocysteine-specific translation elongation factor [Candidatus Eremiobacteraeota bacterium]